jgi:hypothetical protein
MIRYAFGNEIAVESSRRNFKRTDITQVSIMNLQRFENRQQLIPAAHVEASQAETLATALSRALHNEPDMAYMFPNEETRRIVSPVFFLSAIRAGQGCGEIRATEDPAGVAVWIRPEYDLPHHRTVRMGPIALPFNDGSELTSRYMRLGASVEEIRKRLAPHPHWYLMVFGAAAPWPASSLSQALIEPVLSQADSTGTPCYLETFNEKRLPFYKAFGFRIAGAGRIPDGGPNFWAMTRDGSTH